MNKRISRAAPLLLALLLLAACRQRLPSADDIELAMSASELRVGETTLLVTVTDKAGQPLANPGRLSVRADMTHAGMLPVLAEAEAAVDGVFSLPLEWTMGGDWIVEARLSLADGSVASQTFSFQVESQASGSPDMAHRHSQPSAAYMRISNRGDSDISLVSANSPSASQISFHTTVIAEEQARMEALPELRIAAGSTLELTPGSIHIMLMGLSEDLAPGSRITLSLQDDRGGIYALEMPVMTSMMSGHAASQTIGALVFSGMWARPAKAGG